MPTGYAEHRQSVVSPATETDQLTTTTRRGALGTIGVLGAGSLVGTTPASAVGNLEGRSLHSILSQGYVAGVAAAGGIMAADPTDYASDDAAIQAVNDWLAGNGVTGGDIYIPAAYPDGKGPWTIENQVTIGAPKADARIQNNLYFVGYALDWGGEDSHMTTTIDDGDQLFRVVGNPAGGNTVRGFTWRGGKFRLGGNDAGLVRFEYVTNVDFAAEWCKDFTGDGVVFDTRSFEPVMRRVRFKPDDEVSNPTANCIVFEDTHDDGTPTQAMIGKGVNSDGKHNVTILTRAGVNSLYVAGKYEGAAGRATIDADADAMNIFLTPQLQIGNNHDGAHGVYFDSYRFACHGSYLTQIDGDAIHVKNAKTGFVSPTTTYNSIGGDAIHLEDETNDAVENFVIPYRQTVGQDAHTVRLPSNLPHLGIHRIDGWRLWREGTSTITAGESSVVTEWGHQSGFEHKATIEFDSAPGDDIEIAKRIGYHTGEGHPSLVLEGVDPDPSDGTTPSADITWRLWVR